MASDVGEETPDEILMAAYQAGNEAAFDQLFERWTGRVYGFLVRRLGETALAEDLHQETFLRLHRSRGLYDARRPFRAWLFGIAHNLVTDALRSRRRSPVVPSLDESGTARERNVAMDESPEARVAVRESARTLERALGRLPSDEATTLVLARVEGLSYEEIGSILGRSPAATKQLAYRALKHLRAMVPAEGHREH
jgi:RNA polymerase sigma-70 factor (ECF subfamily)